MSWAPRLYLITDRRASPEPLPALVARALASVDSARVAVQLREKDLCARALCELGRAVLAVCRARGVPLLVNDRIDVALAIGAQGVHLGGESLPAREARALLGPSARIGISTHSPDELRGRAEGADFATWGPVYATPSKAKYGPPVGFSQLDRALAQGLPLVALGGVTAETAPELKAAGFAGVACIRAVFGAREPGEAARGLLERFGD